MCSISPSCVEAIYAINVSSSVLLFIGFGEVNIPTFLKVKTHWNECTCKIAKRPKRIILDDTILMLTVWSMDHPLVRMVTFSLGRVAIATVLAGYHLCSHQVRSYDPFYNVKIEVSWKHAIRQRFQLMELIKSTRDICLFSQQNWQLLARNNMSAFVHIWLTSGTYSKITKNLEWKEPFLISYFTVCCNKDKICHLQGWQWKLDRKVTLSYSKSFTS